MNMCVESKEASQGNVYISQYDTAAVIKHNTLMNGITSTRGEAMGFIQVDTLTLYENGDFTLVKELKSTITNEMITQPAHVRYSFQGSYTREGETVRLSAAVSGSGTVDWGRKSRRKTSDAKPKKARDNEERDGKDPPAVSSAGPQSTERPPERPFTLGEKQFGTFEESIADLKDPNKDCSCTPDSLLAEITEFVKKFYQEIEWFHLPYYEGVFPMLSQTQFDYLCRQMDSIHTAADQLTNHVKKGRVNAHGQKE